MRVVETINPPAASPSSHSSEPSPRLPRHLRLSSVPVAQQAPQTSSAAPLEFEVLPRGLEEGKPYPRPSLALAVEEAAVASPASLPSPTLAVVGIAHA